MVLRTNEGGGFDHVARLAYQLAKRGHEVAVAGPRASLGNVEVIEIPIVRSISPRADVRTVRALSGVYRRFRPDIVHAHGSKEGVTARLARLVNPRVPVVYTPHGYAFDSHFSGAGGRAMYRAAEMLAAPLATRVLCVCEAERRLAQRIGPAGRTRVVHNGIEPLSPSVVDSKLEQLRGRGPLVCSLAGAREGKGVETLIDAAPAVLEEFPSVTIVVAGDGPLRASLEDRARKAGVAERFHLHGQVSDVAGVLNAADVFTHPSWAESLPYAVLEAMSLGLPIVATDVGGVAEAVPDRDCALLVPPRDERALGDALRALLRDRDLARELGSAARRRQLEQFSLERMVDGTVAVYEEILARRSGRTRIDAEELAHDVD
jgi:glycosyltransferase involved in cell wall biosynthesis